MSECQACTFSEFYIGHPDSFIQQLFFFAAIINVIVLCTAVGSRRNAYSTFASSQVSDCKA